MKNTILIVDDEAGMRALLSFELNYRGYEVVTVSNGKSALQEIEKGESRFQIVISDLTMPLIGGMELLDAIKSKDPSIKVILITGYGSQKLIEEAQEKGAFGFINKPFELYEMMNLVENGLEA